MINYIKTKKISLIILSSLLCIVIILSSGLINFDCSNKFLVIKDQQLGEYSSTPELSVYMHTDTPISAEVYVDEGSLKYSREQLKYGSYRSNSILDNPKSEYNGLYRTSIYWDFRFFFIYYQECAYMKVLLIENGEYVGYGVIRAKNVSEWMVPGEVIGHRCKYELELIEARKYPKYLIINSWVNYNFLMKKCDKVISKDKRSIKNYE